MFFGLMDRAGAAAPDHLAIAAALVAQAPSDPRPRLMLWKELTDAGRPSDAAAAFKALVGLLRKDADALATFGQLFAQMGALPEADRLFARALEADRRHVTALLGRSAVKGRMGDGDEAAALLRAVARAAPVVPPPADATGPTILQTRCLLSARYVLGFEPGRGFRGRFKGGHFSTDHLMDRRGYRMAIANLVGAEAPLRACASPSLLLNTIACADRARPSLQAVARFLESRPDLPVVNHPDAVLRTTRDATAERLGGVPGARFAKIRPYVAGADPLELVFAIETEFAYPLIVRRAGTHTGDSVALAGDRGALSAYLGDTDPGTRLYAIAYEDARDPAGIHRKGRAFLIDGVLHPVALLGSDQWQIHSGDRYRIMAGDERLRSEERAYLADPEAALGRRRWAALREVCAGTGLDFVGVDFAPVADGVLVFEVNAAMRHNFDHAGRFPYTRPHLERVSRAFQKLVVDRIAAPPSGGPR